MPYIYVIENDINGKKYVGKTNFSIEKRFQEHLSDSTKTRKEHRPLYNAIQKYGREHFSIRLVEEVPLEEVDEKEILWISFFNSYEDGYNATIGGDGKTLLDYHKILKLFDSTLMSQKEIAAECNCSKDSVCNIVEQYRDNVDWSRRAIEKKISSDNKTEKSVLCVEENLVFDSPFEAADWLIAKGLLKARSDGGYHIREVCQGKRKTVGKYHWRYADMVESEDTLS